MPPKSNSKQEQAAVVAAMEASLRAAKKSPASSSPPSSASPATVSLEHYSDNREALISHFREATTRKCLLALSERRREEILEYYYKELVAHMMLAAKEKKEKGAGQKGAESVGEEPIVIPAGDDMSPVPTVARAIGARIHYFHSMEATVNKLMAAEVEREGRSFYYALAFIAAFLIFMVGGVFVVATTDNELKGFLKDLFTDERRRAKRAAATAAVAAADEEASAEWARAAVANHSPSLSLEGEL